MSLIVKDRFSPGPGPLLQEGAPIFAKKCYFKVTKFHWEI